MEDQYGHEFCEEELEPVEKKYLVKEMMGNSYEDYFPKHPDDNERHLKHLWDAMHPL